MHGYKELAVIESNPCRHICINSKRAQWNNKGIDFYLVYEVDIYPYVGIATPTSKPFQYYTEVDIHPYVGIAKKYLMQMYHHYLVNNNPYAGMS